MTVRDYDITDAGDFKNPSYDNATQRIKVIGVGGGGNNAVMHMHRQGIKDVSFVLLNTDYQVLKDSTVPTKLLIGPGLGAGGDPERARKYAEENAEKIAELFDDKTDMVFITAGMGGGTGTGAAPVVARIAKEKGILTVGIVTVPFIFEGEKRVVKALEGAEEMAKNVDSLLVINNQRLTEIYQNLHIFNAFAKADDTLLNAAQSITDIITTRGVINRDFNDVDTTLREGGTAIISTGYGEGPNRVTAAITDALKSPLLKNTDVFGSKKLLMVLYVSDDPENHPFNMEETKELDEFVLGIHKDVDVMWGLYQHPDLGDKVKITILASGFEMSGVDGTEHFTRIQNNDKRITDTYGHGSSAGTGIIIDPSKYDNPEDDEIRDLEYKPAIDRNPYKNFIGAKNAYRGNNSQNEKDQNNETTDKTQRQTTAHDKNDDGATILDFNNLD